jgi:hypothetical protein
MSSTPSNNPPDIDLLKSHTRDDWFAGPKGIRAGWRLLMFVAILLGLFTVLQFSLRPLMRKLNSGAIHPLSLTPQLLFYTEAASLIVLLIAAAIMGRIEARNLADYGLPWRPPFPKHFWTGLAWGFVSISAVILAIFALRGFNLTGIATHGSAAAFSGIEWAAVFVVVGMFEEFLLRGYAQFTLTMGIGFWPAAFLLSAVFAALHSQNGGESKFGLFCVALFGLFACLALRRTGNLWWPIGFHAAWDWGQTFFYGVPDSGLPGSHTLWMSQFHGPRWLTGGTVGPEASIFTPIVLLLAATLVARFYPRIQYPRPMRPIGESAVFTN